MALETVADFLAEGLCLPLPDNGPPAPVPEGTVCCLSGQPLTEGYRWLDLTTSATTEFLDHAKGDLGGYCSVNAARCYRSSNPRDTNPCAKASLSFADVLYLPVIGRESAAQVVLPWGKAVERPCWSELIRQAWRERRGAPVLCILSTDFKKRLWPRARVGALGTRTPVYLYDSATCLDGPRLLDWGAWVECLELVERVYALGYPKPVIRESLYRYRKGDLRETARWERVLAPWRSRPEFAPAVLIAQKPAEGA